ncbi:flagellar hook-length control protein FliK [Simiduia sp. 21SJ11W-1]|uniref:flagellar hook-length control protein FliK n=1 Tax=Simiduia sp. 21SJ11W-1 TaxID=2909669 RepID=UPI00209DD441|nr:flagellar hook-length control protein FliK [Simiduia sp. 21SJ11W-1]UTA49491.1 flagellar hook-length control protein FliK [Simiduia sp. 21SJ11W-1]
MSLNVSSFSSLGVLLGVGQKARAEARGFNETFRKAQNPGAENPTRQTDAALPAAKQPSAEQKAARAEPEATAANAQKTNQPSHNNRPVQEPAPHNQAAGNEQQKTADQGPAEAPENPAGEGVTTEPQIQQMLTPLEQAAAGVGVSLALVGPSGATALAGDTGLSAPHILSSTAQPTGLLSANPAGLPLGVEQGVLNGASTAVDLEPVLAGSTQGLASVNWLAGAQSQRQVLTGAQGSLDAGALGESTAFDALESELLHMKTAGAKEPQAGVVKVNALMQPAANTLNVNLLAEAKLLDNKILEQGLSTDLKAGALQEAGARPLANGLLLNAGAQAQPQKPLPITVPVNQPNWGQAAGERVLWMISSKLQTADIQLDPPELGPLQVKVHVNNDQVSLTFVSPHAHVREALDFQALRLREMLEGQGLNLVDVDVSDQSFQSQQEQAGSDAQHQGGAESDPHEAEPVLSSISGVSLQLIDAFA